jgi:hypothetical protein
MDRAGFFKVTEVKIFERPWHSIHYIHSRVSQQVWDEVAACYFSSLTIVDNL